MARPVSTEAMYGRETLTASASSCCVISSMTRVSRQRRANENSGRDVTNRVNRTAHRLLRYAERRHVTRYPCAHARVRRPLTSPRSSGRRCCPLRSFVVVAIIALRVASLFVHGIVKALLDREATEGTSQELSAVELKKRMDTLDDLGIRVIQVFIVAIAGLMLLGKLGLDIGPAVAGLGVIGIAVGFGAQTLVRDYLNGALILVENQFSKGDVVRIAGRLGHRRGLHASADDGARHRWRRPHRAQRRDQGRLQPDPRLGTDQRGRHGRLRHRYRPGDRRRRPGRPRAPHDPVWKRRILEPPRVERVEALGEYGVTLKILGSVSAPEQWAAGGEFRKRLLAALEANGIEIPRPQRVILSRDPAAALAGSGAAGAAVSGTAIPPVTTTLP